MNGAPASADQREELPVRGNGRRQASIYGEGGIRTLDGDIHPHNALAGRRLQPLGHFSETIIVPPSQENPWFPRDAPSCVRSLRSRHAPGFVNGGARLQAARRGVRAAEGARLEIAYSSKGGSRVQIPPSPPRSSLVRGTRNITLHGHVTSPVPRHAEQAGTPLTYPTGIGNARLVRAFSCPGSVVDARDQVAAAHDLDGGSR